MRSIVHTNCLKNKEVRSIKYQVLSKLPFFLILNTLHLILFLFSSCHSGPEKPTFTDLPTSGEVTIVCDESYQPLISVENDTFQSIYKYAKVNVKYLPEAEAFKELVSNDSIRLIV